MSLKVPFNKPHLSGNELEYIADALHSGHISGNGKYTKLCHRYFEQRFGIKKALLTTSCTDALEMCAMLIDIKPGDEVIVPSFTFVSTALAFVRAGAKIVFADSSNNHPDIDESGIESLITPKTRAIVPVHYAGVACNMDVIMEIAAKYNLFVIEDAAQAIDSCFISKTGERKALGTIGHLAAFSFHETKNIQCGEGGLLAINDDRFIHRAEILWEKGTNRAEFFRGEVNKYGWVDTGSSFLPSDLTAAFLYAQLENLEQIQSKRVMLWNTYYEKLSSLIQSDTIQLPYVPTYATNNGHMFYILCNSLQTRTSIIERLKHNNVHAVFHYISLHSSEYYLNKHDGRKLMQSDRYTDTLLRLPLFYELSQDSIESICTMLSSN